MIGNEEDARFILDWCESVRGDSYELPRRRAPKVWEYLSCGSYRVAYLHKGSGVVYKVQHRYGRSEWQTNEGEAENLRLMRLKRIPEGCRLPRFQYFHLNGNGVMAMERFRVILKSAPHSHRYDGLLNRLRDALGLVDLHSSNAALDEEHDLVVPIDLGA